MKSTAILCLSLFLCMSAAHSETSKCKNQHQFKPSTEKLKSILNNHKIWLGKRYQDKNDPLYANLCNYDLSNIDLSNATLTQANLSNVLLIKTNLSNADLVGANLSQTRSLDSIFLKANFSTANLTDVIFSHSNFTKAFFYYTDLTNARLERSNFSGAIFSNANLSNADITKVNLTDAIFEQAIFTNAKIIDTNLTNTFLLNSKFTNTLYEPSISGIPILESLIGNSLFHHVQFNNPRGLIALRYNYLKNGINDEAKKLTRLIRNNKNNKLFEEDVFKKIEALFNLVLFDWTTDWGVKPGRAMLILLFGIFTFSLFYLAALQTPKTEAGIWRIRGKKRLLDRDKDDIELIQPTSFMLSILAAFHFSLISAFHFGWKDLNVGSWIHRLQGKEYTFRATGWVRTVAGIQSLMSVYLVAIWALTFFGRPFN